MNPTALALAKIGFAFFLVLQLLPFCIWLERKLCAYIQDRIGPNRATLFGTIRLGGMVHSITDVLKLATKEDIRPSKVSPVLYLLGPFLVVVPPFLALAVIPWADDLPSAAFGLPAVPCPLDGARECFPLQIARLDVGVLYVFAVAGLSVIGIMLAGWASNNKYSLLGALRSAAQLVSYEVALTLAAVGMMVIYGTVRVEEMIALQGGPIWNWGIFYQPLAFVIFLIAIFAESNRLPFDLPEGESELVAGYHTEYTGLKFAIFMMAEYSHMIVSSAIIAAVFLGGWQLPFLPTETLRANSRLVLQVIAGGHGALFVLAAIFLSRRFLRGPSRFGDRRDYEPMIWGVVLGLGGIGALAFAATAPSPSANVGVWIVAVAQLMTFVGKIVAFLFLYMWVRWTLPRFRFDQVMRLGWKGLMPLALLNVVATGAMVLWVPAEGALPKPAPFAIASLVLLTAAIGAGAAAGRRPATA